MSSALEAPPTIDREQPDDSPGQAAKDNPYARSAAARAQRGPFVSIQVNVDESGKNIVGDAANEPSIAINPTNPDNIVLGWRQFDNVDSNFRQAGRAYSFDGGLTWTNTGVHTPGVFRSDPVLGSDNDGNIYYYSLKGDFFCDMFKSSDGGVSWVGPTPAFGGDKAWMTVDKTGGVGEGNIYVAWSTAGNPFFPNQFTRSLDGGQTWPDLVQIPPEQPRWGTLTVDPTGDLYISGTNNGNLWVAKSTNAKFASPSLTFDFTVEVDLGGLLLAFAGDGTPNPGGLHGQMWVAADTSDGPSSGNVYMLASVDPPGSDPLNVMFSRSEDGGVTWSAPLRVNDDPPGTNAWQWFGTMSVAPNGRIDVIWNDTRNSGVANLSELFYSFSTDEGATWATNIPVSPMFDSHVGWPDQNKIGDYYDMISDNSAANLAYAATFNGEQDVYFLRLVADCNDNDIPDDIDIDNGTSDDCNDNNVPDECEPDNDCNTNGIQDICDIANGTSNDCNGNGIPDECIELENDCNSNLTPDECDIADGISQDCGPTHNCCGVAHGPGCSDPQIEACICAVDAFCCTVDWDSVCVGEVEDIGCGDCGGSGNGVPDECEPDCNDNSVPDECDIADETSLDANGNGVPDECEGPACGDCPTDVDGNGQTEAFDLANLLGAWGPVTPGSACLDADGNGLIEAFDLALLLGSWGPCE